MMNTGAQTVSQFPQGHTLCFWHVPSLCAEGLLALVKFLSLRAKDKRTKKQNKTGLSRMFNLGLTVPTCKEPQAFSKGFRSRFMIIVKS